jgi:hypothetical protein
MAQLRRIQAIKADSELELATAAPRPPASPRPPTSPRCTAKGNGNSATPRRSIIANGSTAGIEPGRRPHVAHAAHANPLEGPATAEPTANLVESFHATAELRPLARPPLSNRLSISVDRSSLSDSQRLCSETMDSGSTVVRAVSRHAQAVGLGMGGAVSDASEMALGRKLQRPTSASHLAGLSRCRPGSAIVTARPRLEVRTLGRTLLSGS